MNVFATALPGVLILQSAVHRDPRGHFVEAFRQRDFDRAIGHEVRFVQDNLSHSTRGALRGLHYQLPPHEQGKFVRVVQGRVWDVAVDLRVGSPTYGRWLGTELDADDGRALWVPPGMAHGLLVLSETADVLYKCTAYHAPHAERALRWDDPHLGIAWPLASGQTPLLSPRDASAAVWDLADKFSPDPR